MITLEEKLCVKIAFYHNHLLFRPLCWKEMLQKDEKRWLSSEQVFHGWQDISRCFPRVSSLNNTLLTYSHQTSFFWSVPAAFSDSHPTLYVVPQWWSRLGSALFGPRITGLALPWTTYDCLRMLQACFRKRISDSHSVRSQIQYLSERSTGAADAIPPPLGEREGPTKDVMIVEGKGKNEGGPNWEVFRRLERHVWHVTGSFNNN